MGWPVSKKNFRPLKKRGPGVPPLDPPLEMDTSPDGRFWTSGNCSLWNRISLNFFFVESGILDFGIQNPAQCVWNPANDWNPKSKFLRWFFPCWRGFSPVFRSRKNPTLPSFNSIQNSRTRLNEFLRTPKGLQQSRDFLINFSCFRFLMETKIVTPLCITS